MRMLLLRRMRWLFFLLAVAAFAGGWFFVPLFWVALVLLVAWGSTWIAGSERVQHSNS
ncbi:MAG: hypothetical protein M5U23_10270 [Acidimicrobiia bacterium]|nr:hypothetical protein [Acidimicrobiia bacterium]